MVQVIVFRIHRPSARGTSELTRSTPKRLYLIPVLSKALDILELLQNEKGPLALEGIYQRTNISKTTVYRILKTFVHRGYWRIGGWLIDWWRAPRKRDSGLGVNLPRCLFPRR